MQDHSFEEFEEEQERETVDSLAELEHFWHARGDDRTEFSPYEYTGQALVATAGSGCGSSWPTHAGLARSTDCGEEPSVVTSATPTHETVTTSRPRLTRCGPASDPSEGAGCSGNRKEAA